MKFNYDSVAVGAQVMNGKVEYYREFAVKGRIVYTVKLTEAEFNTAMAEFNTTVDQIAKEASNEQLPRT